MKSYSNTYIFIYASVMVILVAAVLSFTAVTLKPMQDSNIEIEKKQDILASVNISSTPENVVEKYEQYISNAFVINSEGEIVEGNAFFIDLKVELNKPLEERKLPILECKQDDGGTNYIIPVRGRGLWGPIWGYISLGKDLNTVFGATFGHKQETPGLGSDIEADWFQDSFKGKKIFNSSGEFTSIDIVTGGTDTSNPNGVDAISGGTITSKAVQAMLYDCLSSYLTYFKNKSTSQNE